MNPMVTVNNSLVNLVKKQVAGVEPHQDKHEHSGPESNPESELQELNVLHVAEVEDQAFEYQCRARGPEDDKGLTRKDGVDEVTNANSKDGFCGALRGGGRDDVIAI